MNLDAADKAFLDTFIPEGALAEQIVVAVAFIDAEDGSQKFKTWHEGDVPISVALGLLECARMDLLDPTWKDRCPSVETAPEDDDG